MLYFLKTMSDIIQIMSDIVFFNSVYHFQTIICKPETLGQSLVNVAV